MLQAVKSALGFSEEVLCGAGGETLWACARPADAKANSDTSKKKKQVSSPSALGARDARVPEVTHARGVSAPDWKTVCVQAILASSFRITHPGGAV